MHTLYDLSETQICEVTGGDWLDTTFGIAVGTAFTAGLVGSGGLLAVAFGIGGLMLTVDTAF